MSRLCQSWNFDETIFKGMKHSYELNPKKPFKRPLVICDREKNSFSNMIYHHHPAHVTPSINGKIATSATEFLISSKWSPSFALNYFFHILRNQPQQVFGIKVPLPSPEFLGGIFGLHQGPSFSVKEFLPFFFSNTSFQLVSSNPAGRPPSSSIS